MASPPLPMTAPLQPETPLFTPRLVLRPFTLADADAVYAYRSRPDVAAYLLDEPMSHDQCVEAVRQRVGQVAWVTEGDTILLAIDRRDDGRLIGEVALILRALADQQAEIGYILHPDAQGQGYAAEAATALLDFAFDRAGMHRVLARCHGHNAASLRVMERLGMRQEAHFREHRRFKGDWDDEVVCAILDRDWRARRAGKG